MAQLLRLADGKILKVNDQFAYEMINLSAVKQIDLTNRKMTIVGTDETKDRDGDVIRMAGWQLDNYRKNPVFLWSHLYSSVPLARTEKLIKRRDPVRMEFHLQYPTEKIHPFADMILSLYGEKMINASSVGFIPFEWEEMDEEGKSVSVDLRAKHMEELIKGSRRLWGRDYKSQELLELSGCAVPSNPNALTDALKAKSFFDAPFEEVQKWLQGKSQPPKPVKADDIMEELFNKKAEFVDETKSAQVQVPANYLCSLEEEQEEKKTEVGECNTWDGKIEGLEVPPFEKDFEISKEDVLKPYPNEHACRLEDPGQFERFARKNCFKKHDDKCIDFIFGYPKEGGGKIQALRYKKDVWEASAAKTHCSSHKGTFEAASGASFEPEDQMVLLTQLSETLKGIEVWMKNSLVGSIKDQNTELLEAIKSLKTIGAAPAQPIEQSPKDGNKGKSASEAILGEAFAEKEKEIPSIPPPKSQPQYDFAGIMAAMKELQKSVLLLKGEK